MPIEYFRRQIGGVEANLWSKRKSFIPPREYRKLVRREFRNNLLNRLTDKKILKKWIGYEKK